MPSWTPWRDQEFTRLRQQGATAAQIADELGMSEEQVLLRISRAATRVAPRERPSHTQLQARARQAQALAFFEQGMSYEATAERMGVTLPAIKGLLRRAREMHLEAQA